MNQDTEYVEHGALRVDPRRIAIILASVACILLFGHLLTQAARIFFGVREAYGLIALFNLSQEVALGTWYSTLLLFAAAAAAATIGIRRRLAGEANWRHWVGLGALFVLLSADEASRIHERLAQFVPAAIGDRLPAPSWVVAGLLFVVVVGGVYFRFLIRLPAPTRRLVLVAALLFVGGALGMEILTGLILHWTLDASSYWHQVLIAAEEGLEMTGLVVFVYALLRFLEVEYRGIEFHFGSPPH